jgi:hypothetical protein
MTGIDRFLHRLAIGTIPVVGFCLCLLLLQLTWGSDRLTKDSDANLLELHNSLVTVNHPCKPGPCGTLAKFDQTMNVAQSLAAAGNGAILDGDEVARTEMALLPEWNRQFTQTMSSVQTTVSQAGADEATLTTSLTGAIDTTEGTIAKLQPTEDAATQSVKDFDALVRNPHIADLVTHVDDMSASGDKMLFDAQWKTHQLLHPDKVKLGFWGSVWVGVKTIHGLEPPLF